MRKLIKFKSTPLPRILHLSNGIITFKCTCEGTGSEHISKFNRLTRCKTCELRNEVIKMNEVLGNSPLPDSYEADLFEVFYISSLKDYINTQEESKGE